MRTEFLSKKYKPYEACMSVERDGEQVDLIIRGTFSRFFNEAVVSAVVVDSREQAPWTGELTDAEEKEANEKLVEAAADDDSFILADPPDEDDF